MKKYVVITGLVIVALAVAVLTFFMEILEFMVGAVFTGITVLIAVIVWIKWKITD
ncbi:MAG: hypothetical protein WBG71_01645 [Leeuwenhoekiella sp.]